MEPFVQSIYPGPNDPPIPTYVQSPPVGSNIGGVRPGPTASTNVPASQTGQAGDFTIGSIAGAITSGFQSLRTQHAIDFESQLNLPAGSLPLLTTGIGGLLNLKNELQSTPDRLGRQFRQFIHTTCAAA